MLRCYALRMALPQHYAAPSPRMPEWEGATLPTGNPLYPSVTFRFAGDAVHLTLHGTQDVHFAAGLSGPLASPVFSRGLVALGSDFETIYSSTACFDRQDLLTVTTRVIGAPTLLYLRADFSAMRATLNTLRGNFDHP